MQFGGNPVSMAAVEAVLGVLKSGGLVAEAATKGATLLTALDGLRSRVGACVGDVRGVGLFAGVELVKEGWGGAEEVGEPDEELATWVILELRRKHGVLVSAEGPHGNVLKFKPPMCFSFQDIQTVPSCLSSLESCLFVK